MGAGVAGGEFVAAGALGDALSRGPGHRLGAPLGHVGELGDGFGRLFLSGKEHGALGYHIVSTAPHDPPLKQRVPAKELTQAVAGDGKRHNAGAVLG